MTGRDPAPPETRVSGETVFSGRLIRVRRDIVALSGGCGVAGRTVVREVVEHPGAVGIAPVNGAGEIILVRQYRYPVGEHVLEVPAGKIEEGEAPEVTARRELAEETGLSAGSLTPLGVFHTTPGFCDETMRLFLATDLGPASGRAQADEDEAIELVTMPLREAVSLAEAGGLRDAKTICAVFLAAAALGGAAGGKSR